MPLPKIPAWTPPPPPPEADVKAQYADALTACKGSVRRYFDIVEDTELFTMSSRDGGSVGDETPGDGDIATAKEILAAIQSRFPLLKTGWETVDEWTSVIVECKPRTAPQPPLHGREFWQEVLSAAVAALKAEGFELYAEAGFLSGAAPRLHIPVIRRENRDSPTAMRGKINEALTKLFRAEGYKGGIGYISAGGQTAGIELETLPKWAAKL